MGSGESLKGNGLYLPRLQSLSARISLVLNQKQIDVSCIQHIQYEVSAPSMRSQHVAKPNGVRKIRSSNIGIVAFSDGNCNFSRRKVVPDAARRTKYSVQLVRPLADR